MSAAPFPPTHAQNPWPGLFSYTEEQAHLFFGREAETDELLRLIQRETLTVLFGRSGLGKTSLLRAGVFPRLRRDGFFPVFIRLDYAPQAAGLAEQVRVHTESAARSSGIDIESAQQAPQNETLWEYFRRIHIWGTRNDRLTPVLVLDQFEEFFTLGSGRQRDSGFFVELADLAENRIPDVVRQRAERSGERKPLEAGVPNYKIVLSLREDFAWLLDTLRPILPAVMRNRFKLPPLDAARGLEIVRNAFKQWVSEEVARDIIEAVISSRRGEGSGGAADEVEPAYLNVMCNELFERMVAAGQTQITRELVASEKGGILESLYERSLSGFDDSVRRFVEDHMVTPAGFRATVPVEEARREGISDDDLQKLVDRHFLQFEDHWGTKHVELAHDLLTEYVKKSRERRNQVRLQRKLRVATIRTVGSAALALLLIGGAAFYWLAYVHPSVSYYAALTSRYSSYELIGRLSGDQVRHRSESLKVTREGFRGRIQTIEAVNGYGHLIMDSQLEESLLFPSKDINGQFCSLVFTYDEKGQINHEVAVDEQGRMVFALTYAPAEAEPLRNLQRGSLVASDGTTVISSFNLQYGPDGYLDELRFSFMNSLYLQHANLWNTSANVSAFNNGATIIDLKDTFDASGMRTTKELDLDVFRRPVPANRGFAGATTIVDSRGNFIEEISQDASGRPVPSPDGYPPVTRYQHDKWGNQSEESFYDAAGNPAIYPSEGFQKEVVDRDDRGFEKGQRFFGLDGQPVPENGTGCFAYIAEPDQNGIPISNGCLDAQGAPMNELDSGYQKQVAGYDSSGRFIETRYYDRDGKPVADKRSIGALNPQGCYGYLWGYDQFFNRTLTVCLNADGKAHSPMELLSLANASREFAFDFARAFDLDQQLVEQVPQDALFRLDLERSALAAGHFDVCLTQAADIRDSDVSSSLLLVVRDATLLACEFAGGTKLAASTTAASLTNRLVHMTPADQATLAQITTAYQVPVPNPAPASANSQATSPNAQASSPAAAAPLPKISPLPSKIPTRPPEDVDAADAWSFTGTRYYIQTSNYFQADSDAWDKLFANLQTGDRQGAVDALNQLQPLFKR
jgi:hypothetical protein